jgi:hypothetical protein
VITRITVITGRVRRCPAVTGILRVLSNTCRTPAGRLSPRRGPLEQPPGGLRRLRCAFTSRAAPRRTGRHPARRCARRSYTRLPTGVATLSGPRASPADRQARRVTEPVRARPRSHPSALTLEQPATRHVRA